jgi:hypothetical protein
MTTSITVTTYPWAPQPEDDIFILDEASALHLVHLGRPSSSAAIRAYGDHAVFNRIQIPDLVEDLRRVATEIVNDEACRGDVLALADFIEEGVHRLHTTTGSTQSYVVALAD